MKAIYKNQDAKAIIMQYYEEKLASLGIDYEEQNVETRLGKTHVIFAGNPHGKK